ncbi:Smr/MutS family protein [Azospirillum oryzae]|uniref:Smr/MutS family protein n=1 Tax=Azospirillum oryzae TaxID=286727 RepID=A0A6N1AGW5_9PROT|nr:Smr/MutS family protein [Azospirillum oryzae]KAA0586079.1 DNA mismatch repair protein MutS [Azospirillum oryzae]QKS50955.1 Smr/MutS family protein [Azospirillum oryzae]GLR79217.1 smr protein/Muts2-like [Azospirillum oryzae]
MTRRRLPTPDERRLWRLAMRDAEPMPGRAIEAEPEPVATMAELVEEPVATSLAPPPTARRHPSPPGPARPSHPPLTPGSTANIDRRTGDRFRRGELEIDGRIDLHGMTQAQAHNALAAFVHRAWNEGRRCVLVITGKGSFGGLGVLRQATPRWLSDPALRPMVLAIQPARPKDGGDGALYVLIKRRRDRKD